MSDETITCPSCGASLVAGTGFCGQCGAPIGPAIPPPSPMFGAPTTAAASATPIDTNKGRNEPFKEATEPESFPPPPPPPSPYTPPPSVINAVPSSSGNQGIMAIASLVIGVLSLCAWLLPICGCPLAIIGAVLGVLGLKSDKKTLAIIGLVLCGIALILCIINGVAGAYIGSNPDFLNNLFNN